MNWIYLSPHFDDVALSCGGLVWEQVQAHTSVSIWTVCAGGAPEGALSSFAKELHTRWDVGQDATTWRKIEDSHACHRLGVTFRYFSIPDCIYRSDPLSGDFLYTSDASLSGPLQPADAWCIALFQDELMQSTKSNKLLISPLGLGNHVDHQLTRIALEESGHTLWYYQDYPYVLRSKEKLKQMEQEGWVSQVFPVSKNGLVAWQDSIAAHGSQISTFWSSEAEMRRAIEDYLNWNCGILLWRKPVL